MAYVVLGVFLALVIGAAWLSAGQRRGPNGCCAPADPGRDLRMRAALDDTGRQPADRQSDTRPRHHARVPDHSRPSGRRIPRSGSRRQLADDPPSQVANVRPGVGPGALRVAHPASHALPQRG
jgi:hypothetical protein